MMFLVGFQVAGHSSVVAVEFPMWLFPLAIMLFLVILLYCFLAVAAAIIVVFRVLVAVVPVPILAVVNLPKLIPAHVFLICIAMTGMFSLPPPAPSPTQLLTTGARAVMVFGALIKCRCSVLAAIWS